MKMGNPPKLNQLILNNRAMVKPTVAPPTAATFPGVDARRGSKREISIAKPMVLNDEFRVMNSGRWGTLPSGVPMYRCDA
jgi:hypothetical protein